MGSPGAHRAQCEILPDGILYPAYLADTQASRLAGVFNNDEHLGWIWDATLGGTLPLFRWGSRCRDGFPEGFQIDVEASAHLRLDFENSFELYSCDYRVGIPVSWGNRTWQFKSGFYHSSSHAGDEFITRQYFSKEWVNEGGSYRFNYSRDSILLGIAWRPITSFRVYGELDYDVSKPTDSGGKTSLHVLMGCEYSRPYRIDQRWGSPFAAFHVRLYEEKDYAGNVCVQFGWQFRKKENQVFRVGVQYYYGIGEQYQTLSAWWKKENKVGIGLWYDF